MEPLSNPGRTPVEPQSAGSALLPRSGSEAAQTGATGSTPRLLVAEDELCLTAQKLREKEEVLVAQGAAARH